MNRLWLRGKSPRFGTNDYMPLASTRLASRRGQTHYTLHGMMCRMNRALMKIWLSGASFALAVPAFANQLLQVPDVASVDGYASIEPTAEASAPPLARLQDLAIHAISLVGVKYKFGGNSAQSGFDCSGFVRHVFAESLALELPRSSYAMGKLGLSVPKDDLSPGDLVFFNTLRRSFSHVGIYLGEGRFVHSPSRGKSVEIVDMSDNYWKKRFNGARRLVTE